MYDNVLEDFRDREKLGFDFGGIFIEQVTPHTSTRGWKALLGSFWGGAMSMPMSPKSDGLH